MLLAADQLINHAALFPEMSGGKIRIPMIIRACIGSRDIKFDVGRQHQKDFSSLFEPYMEVTPAISEGAFEIPAKMRMTIEWKDMYGQPID